MKIVLKKMVSAVFVALMILSLIKLSAPQKVEAITIEGEEDASCLQPQNGYWYFTSWRILHQWWRPQHNQVNDFWMWADTSGGGTFHLTLKEWLTGTQVATATATATGATAGWVQFNFPNAAVNQGELYYVSITGSYPNRWYTHDPDDCNTQNMTSGITSSGTLNFYYDSDFLFYVYGQTADAPPPAADPPAAVGGTPPAGGTDPGGVAPGGDQPVATSEPIASINPPTEAKAEDVPNDQGGSVTLSWKKSDTTGITGYRVFRSDSETGKFTRLGSVKSGVLEYVDTGADIGKKFFYSVRAYNSKGESSDSNKVSVASVDNLAPATPTEFKAANDDGKKTINLSWAKNTELDLASYSLSYGTDEKKLDKTLDIKQDDTSYQLSSVEAGRNYFFALSAKDSHSNVSAPANSNLKTPNISLKNKILAALKKPLTWAIGGGIILLLAGLITFLIIRRKKKLAKAAV